MPETKRLNIPMTCNGCATQVNPYVLEERADLSVHLECPTCGYDWWEDIERT